MNAIQEVIDHAKALRETVSPGQPAVINEAAAAGDRVWQGDLAITVVVRRPNGFGRVENPTERDCQLAPGTTQGSRHMLRDPSTVEFWRPENADVESLTGPYLKCLRETVIDHPVHGAVTIAAGHGVQISYQREWDAEQRRQRRNAD